MRRSSLPATHADDSGHRAPYHCSAISSDAYIESHLHSTRAWRESHRRIAMGSFTSETRCYRDVRMDLNGKCLEPGWYYMLQGLLYRSVQDQWMGRRHQSFVISTFGSRKASETISMHSIGCSEMTKKNKIRAICLVCERMSRMDEQAYMQCACVPFRCFFGVTSVFKYFNVSNVQHRQLIAKSALFATV